MTTDFPGPRHAKPGMIARLRSGPAAPPTAPFPVKAAGTLIMPAVPGGPAPQDPGFEVRIPGTNLPEGMTEVPVWEPPGADGLKDAPDLVKVRDAIKAIPAAPAARLRVFPDGEPLPLTGLPSFAGTDTLPGGGVMAGLWLDTPDIDGRLVIDVTDPAWLRALITAARDTLAALEAQDTPGAGEEARP